VAVITHTPMSLISFAKKMAGRDTRKAQRQTTKATPADTTSVKSTATAASAITKAGALGLQPLITESSLAMQGNTQTVAFRVRPTANKQAIIAAVAERFGVEPVSVRTIHVAGKTRRRGRTVGTTAAWKKAYVTLPAGKTIDITA
jgi:large subunit ribosomal protein L23